MFDESGPSMSHRIKPLGNVQVNTISLGSLIDSVSTDYSSQINLMKVDIEGSEEEFIAGQKMLLLKVDKLIIELHPSLCNASNVRSNLAARYNSVVEIPGRTSSKPLLLCY